MGDNTLPQRIRAGCDTPRRLMMQYPYSLPQRIRAGCDCLATSSMRVGRALPQRIRAGCDGKYRISLHNQNPLPQRIRAGCDVRWTKFCTYSGLCHSAFVRVATAEKQCSALRICCEKVDSFSSVGESGLALTIFPFSFAAKATYVAINDSFGRAIDRFFGANRTGISVSYDFAEHPCL